MSGPTARVTIEFADEVEAERIEAALQADDDPFVSTRREGRTVVLDARGSDLRSLRRALDDALACAGVSEAVIKSASLDD